MILLQAETALKMANGVLENSKEQGFIVYMMVALLILFVSLFIIMFFLYIQKQNKIIEILEKQADTRRMFESIADAKLHQLNTKNHDMEEMKKMMQDMIRQSQEAAKHLK